MKLLRSKWHLPTLVGTSVLTFCTPIFLINNSSYSTVILFFEALSLFMHSISKQKNESTKTINIRYESFLSSFFLLIISILLLSVILSFSGYKLIPTDLLLYLTVIFLLLFNYIFYIRLTIAFNKRKINYTRIMFSILGLTSIFLFSWIMLEKLVP